MSAGQRRPQVIPERGKRVVLIAARPDLGNPDRALAGTIENIDRIGWILVSVVDPSRFMDALRMVVNGLVDFVVSAKPEYFPYVIMSADLGAYGSQSAIGAERTRMLPRLGNGDSPRQRRPQPVERTDEPAAEPGQVSKVGHLPETVTGGRTELVDRSARDQTLRPTSVRRPKLVGPESEFGRAVAQSGHAEARAEIRMPATDPLPQTPAFAGAESGTHVPDPVRRPRASDRRGRVVSGDRRRH